MGSVKYVLCGRKTEFEKYVKNDLSINKNSHNICHVYVRKRKDIDSIKEEDTIVLLKGWWGRSWAKDNLRKITRMYPSIEIEYLDGPFGQEQREELFNTGEINRFEFINWE
jgi:hypothetical protein